MTSTKVRSVPDNKGHRRRLKLRFNKAPIRTLPDYEILEMVLFNVFKRSDTKLLAKRLLKQFGSFQGILAADPIELKKVEGIGDGAITYIKLLEDLFSRILIPVNRELPLLNNWRAVLNYCNLTMGHKKSESFRVFYLNKRNALISDEILQVGTVDRVTIYPREIVKQCIVNSASAIILVHNHPSGDNTPSIEDIEVTKRIVSALKSVNIALHDHLIITHDNHFSFKSNGLL